MRRFVAVALAATAICVLAGDDRHARGAVIPLTVQDLVEQSTICLRGIVVAVDPAWTPDGAMIETTYTLQTLESYMGSAPATVDVRVPGGDLDGFHIRNGEAPVYQLGEEVVCFLAADDRGGWTTFGWFQGKYTVLAGWVRELSGTSLEAFRSQILLAAANK